MKYGIFLILLFALVVPSDCKCCVPDYFKVTFQVDGQPLKEIGEFNTVSRQVYLTPADSSKADYKYKIGDFKSSIFKIKWKNNTCSNEHMPFYYQLEHCVPDNLERTIVPEGVAFTEPHMGYTVVVTKDGPGCHPVSVVYGPPGHQRKVLFSNFSKEKQAPVFPTDTCST